MFMYKIISSTLTTASACYIYIGSLFFLHIETNNVLF